MMYNDSVGVLSRQALGGLEEQTPLPQTLFPPPPSTYQMQHLDWTMRKPVHSLQNPSVTEIAGPFQVRWNSINALILLLCASERITCMAGCAGKGE